MKKIVQALFGQWRPSVLFSLIIFLTQTGWTQNIQPLGIVKGDYRMGPQGSCDAKAFCVDKSIYTYRGTTYDRPALSDNTDIYIGQQKYTLKEAIDKDWVSLSFTKDVHDQMYMGIQNHTGKDVRLHVGGDLVMSTKTSTAPLKATIPLNEDLTGLEIGRQEYIWFYHAYPDYLTKYHDDLIANGLLKEGEELPIKEYLRRRIDFLAANGVKARKVVRHEDEVVVDYEVTHLIHSKKLLMSYSSGDYTKMYLLRLGTYQGKGYYFLDDGSPTAFKSISNTDIIAHIDPQSSGAVIGIADDLPPEKKAALLKNIKDAKISLIEDSHLTVPSLEGFIAKGATIKNVGEITRPKVDFELNIEYTVKEKENHLAVKAKEKGPLARIKDFLGQLTGKKSELSMAEIFMQGKQIAHTAFPNQNVQAKIKMGFKEINISRANLLRQNQPEIQFYAYIPGRR
jgi:hypothetical protein